MGHVVARVLLKGFKNSVELNALVDTGASITIIDKDLADFIGVEYTSRERTLVTASGEVLRGRVAVIREFIIEGEFLDYERVLVVNFNENVKKILRGIGVSDLVILGLTTAESAGFIPDTSTGKLKKTEMFLF
jgi:predicted aspartyl protease